MAALFSRSANTVFKLVLFALALTFAAVVIIPMIFVRTEYSTLVNEPVTQPVEFDHRHHVMDDGIECLYCHSEAERAATAGMPATELCMGCHNQIRNESPLLELVRDSYFSGRPIRWNRVHEVPDFTYFNHSVHIQGGVECAQCHGQVEQMARVYRVAPLNMGWCLDCHRQQSKGRAVTSLTTCSACHR